MPEFTIEQVDMVLNYPTIEVMKSANPIESFERWRTFMVHGLKYQIEWYVNHSYLHSPGGVTVLFKSIQRKNTWPHRSKMNLQFYDDRGEVCCVLKIEDCESDLA